MTSDMAGSNHYLSKLGMGDMEKDGWFLRTASSPVYANSLYLNTGGKAFGEVAHGGLPGPTGPGRSSSAIWTTMDGST